MHLQTRTYAGRLGRQTRSTLAVLLTVVLLALAAFPPTPASVTVASASSAAIAVQAVPGQAPGVQQLAVTNTLTLRVVSARTEPRAFDGAGVVEGDQVSAYQFMIVVDNTGDPFDDTDCYAYLDPPANTMRNPNYPDGCDWPGVQIQRGLGAHLHPGHAGGPQRDRRHHPSRRQLPDLGAGRRLQGRRRALYGAAGRSTGLIEVGCIPYPLPPAEMVIKVFNDNAMTNGQFDAPVEDSVCPGEMCMAGFRAIAERHRRRDHRRPLWQSALHHLREGPPHRRSAAMTSRARRSPVPGGGECLSDELRR